MKKTITIVAGLLFCLAATTKAQNATESTIEVLKGTQACVTANYNQNPDVMEDALKAKLQAAKLGSGDKSKGFRIYKGVILPEICADKIDLYTKVDGKKETSTISILVSRGYDNFVNSKTDSAIVNNMKNYLNTLSVAGDKLKLANDTKDQEDLVAKATKKYNSSVDDGKDLQKEKEKLEKRIADNTKEQEDFNKNLQAEKAKLDTLIEKAKAFK